MKPRQLEAGHGSSLRFRSFGHTGGLAAPKHQAQAGSRWHERNSLTLAPTASRRAFFMEEMNNQELSAS
jgi:hypothetical protein